jgi:acetyl-CoA synthetase (ADP-forming)
MRDDMLSMIDTFEMLKKYKLNLAPYSIVDNLEDALSQAKKLGYPVVMKAISSKVSHKTEYGVVRTNLMDDEDVEEAWRIILKKLKKHKIKFEQILIQKQMKGYELIIGGKKDEQFGQMIIFGLGGIYVEVFKDISARICSITEEDARHMIKEIKAHPILAGYRGTKPADEKSLINALIQTNKLLINEDPEELDLNPLFVDDTGYYIVDARVVLSKGDNSVRKF